ncbi:ABC transporter permease [Methylobrevis albus]|uniref:ABC transporter permease n=1 Tax=Methylobrevis albus TaxID=2793297 RepID=A0A931I010_9HYPH|nr:ABC transporter permease [Methylobrevis albus]MBH0236488.1 ABC transporter permease [Methylobrevis albus]
MASFAPRRRFDARGLVIPALIVAGWYVVSESGVGNGYVFVTYDRIWATFAAMVADGTLVASIVGTVLRMAAGFAIGAGFGLLLGLATGLSDLAGRVVSPTFHAVRQIAIFAWMPLLTAWLGIGGQTMIALIALGAFYPMVINVEAGCRNVPGPYLEVGRVLELSRWQTIRRIVLPAAAPAIFAGLELGLATAWLSTIGAEYFIAAGDGLGIILSASRMRGSMDGVIVGIVFIGLVGFAINRLLAVIARRAFAWRGEAAR